MNEYWIPLQSIPSEGKTLVLDDQDLWRAPMKEFEISCRVLEPLRAEIFMLPQAQGILFRGKLTGKVAIPCDRCADDSPVPISHSFDSFEPFPPDAAPAPLKDDGRKKNGRKGSDRATEMNGTADDPALDEIDEAVIRVASHGRGIEVNPAALAWEEFSLVLPVKPLCKDDCLGLCPVCGCNRNTDPCSCVTSEGDARLAALRGLQVNKKQR